MIYDTFIEILNVAGSPVVISAFGFFINKRIKSFEKQQWINQKVIEKRIAVYTKLSPMINNLYCFYMHVGHWKALTPPEIIATKRQLDREMHTNAAFFTPSFLSQYSSFMNDCFSINGGWGEDAKIKSLARGRSVLPGWRREWNDLFCEKYDARTDDKAHRGKIKNSHDALIACFQTELGVKNTH